MRATSAKGLMLWAAPLSVMLVVLLMLLAAEMDLTNAAAAPASTAPTAPPTTSPAPAFAAMAYYDQNCAHCHGPQGSFYGPTLGQKLSDKELQQNVDFMASGPGNAPLTPDQLAAETAFHRALIMRNPFVSVTQEGMDGNWAGETMPDANVTLTVGKQQIVATLDDSGWNAQLPAGTKPSDVKITAESNGATTTLLPSQASYSNTTPLPPPGQRPK